MLIGAVILHGFLAGRAMDTSGQPSWMTGGFGRFDTKSRGVAEAQLGIDWTPVKHVLVHAHGLARAEPRDNRGRHAGLVDAYIESDWDFGRHEFLVRAGQNFLGTSRENVADLWTSPYTLTYSTLNSWIANEVRPVGVTGEWHLLTSTAVITASATAFRNNDTMGALLAWRGWTSGNRLTVYDEVQPLPPLQSLRTAFVHQRNGTVPFEADLDGRTGYAARVRYSVPERFSIQFTRVDNEADRGLHRGEYAWRTPFYVAGADAHFAGATVASEWMEGKSGMGDPHRTSIDINFYSGYLLGSYKIAKETLSARYEVFATLDQHPVATEIYDEHGRAWTLAWLHGFPRNVRAGIEFTRINADHTEATENGFSPRVGGRQVMVELRWSF